ncbi:thioesterase II family protein [Kitasatospora sp. MBT63]|uniref:thioesterase II family protein n=1 Tax=Kitasatospora sp. MBT63 TaxID=1444768 RepID=UPI00053A766E|nr:alpha/beta fold hydrolase [Kitasatospora sp. MBT63]
MSGPDTAAWFRCLRPRPAARTRLLCFPHGGGSSAAYRDWHDLLPDEVELFAVEYPGHADRLLEPLVDDLAELADRACEAALPLLDRPFALYGHSLGALVAYETALRLEARGHHPLRLTASGMPAPRLVRPGEVHLGDDTRVLAELDRLGGVPAEVLDHPDLRELVLRTARADYRLAETYRPAAHAVLRAPVTTHRGLRDPELTEAEAAGWSAATTGATVHRTFPGDHFHPAADRAPVIAEVLHGLRAAPSTPSAR